MDAGDIFAALAIIIVALVWLEYVDKDESSRS